MNAPRTSREALMAELLGDVGKLLDKADAVAAALTAATEASASQAHKLERSTAEAIMKASEQVNAQTMEARQKIMRAAAAAAAGVADQVGHSGVSNTVVAPAPSLSVLQLVTVAFLAAAGGFAGGALALLLR